jgi:phosphate transport system substrate-binding protein
LVLALACLWGAGGCHWWGADGLRLTGAGATFPFPLYTKWIDEFQRIEPGVHINYQSIGSGGGIRQVIARTVDFGATDVPMSDEQLRKAPGPLLHVPTAVGAVVVTYNLPSLPTELRLTPTLLAAIYSGAVNRWDDPRLVADNPALASVALPIAVVYRSDGSGTTAVFTDYLAKVSDPWRRGVGAGTSVRWPTGLGAKGNEGVTGQLTTTPGSIGYIELAYATQSGLPSAALKNRSGRFVVPTLRSMTAAASVADLPPDLRGSLTDGVGAEVYPLTSLTYLLVYTDAAGAAKAHMLGRFLWWATHEGQRFTEPLDYAPLPRRLAQRVEERLSLLRVAAPLGGPVHRLAGVGVR